MKFETKKSLGQNFIRDTGFLNAVLDKLNLTPADTVVEIGAGLGTLTECLAKRVKKVVAYEIDARLKQILTEKFKNSNVEIVFSDALESEINFPHYKIVANIPYYITTPILMKFLRAPACVEICVLVQNEVAKRIVAAPSTPEYGALSVTVQAQAVAKIVKFAPRALFCPIPKVDSAFVVIKKTFATLPKNFDATIKTVFSKRRKVISNSIPKTVLENCGIDLKLRPENLTPDQFVKICQMLP
jgi:16S rRNA (adenine1518-N6/adenine1519-N6)-dimethyltransferase